MLLKSNFIHTLSDLPREATVCLYGAGEGGKTVKKYLEEERRDIHIACFIDDFKQGEINGLRVIALKELSGSGYTYDLILVTSAFWMEMERILVKNHIENYLVINPSLFYPHQIFTEREETEYRDSLRRAQSLLCCNEDRELYEYILKIRGCRQEDVPDFDKGHTGNISGNDSEYMDFINAENVRTVIEGGVLDGKHTLRFLHAFKEDSMIYGFEPNYSAYLESPMRDVLEASGRVRVYPLALWKHKGAVLFRENRDDANASCVRRDRDGDGEPVYVDSISIDDFVAENRIDRVDFIKMDIEGSEIEALEGAVRTLAAHRPQIAVCIYHDKRHLFEIPLLLDRTLENYIYRIRHYSGSFWDTVWYAIPSEVYH